MKTITQTKRLYLREFTPDDAIHFYQMNLDQDVIKFTGDIAFKTEEEAKDFILNYNQYALYNMGRWAVCDKQTHSFLGWCGLKYHPEKKTDKKFIEVGYRFYKKHWGKGYATESTKAVINYGFKTLNLTVIYAHAHINNSNSHKVINKCGLHFVNQANYDGMPANLYKIEAPKIEIKRIQALETYSVRQPVLRAGRPIEDCEFTGDHLSSTIHLGLFVNTNLIGVATFLKQDNSLFKVKNQFQLRGMAILESQQGKGYGDDLIQQGEQLLKKESINLIWFNARQVAISFYKRNQYTCIGNAFDVPNIGTHFVMYKHLSI